MSLLELLFAIVLMAIIVLGLTSIVRFSRYHVVSADRKAKLQSEATAIIEHMADYISHSKASTGGAVGSAALPPIDTASLANGFLVWVDTNQDGAADRQIAYQYDSTNHQINFCSNYPGAFSVIATETGGLKVIRPDLSTVTTQPTYITYSTANNYFDVQISACWDPTNPASDPCGSADNPEVVMRSRIYMPAVSTR